MERELRIIERAERNYLRDAVSNEAHQDSFIELYTNGTLFQVDNYFEAIEASTYRAKDFYRIFQNNGCDFLQDRDIKNKKAYHGLYNIISEFNFAGQLHQNRVIENLDNFGYSITPKPDRPYTLNPNFAKAITLDYQSIEMKYQHCLRCYYAAVCENDQMTH